jgi:uncharacterized membrane protein YjjP (DUF1212 family)
LGLVVLGVSYFAVGALQNVSWLTEFAGLIQIVIVMVIFFSLSRIVRAIKEKVVYPRTGEVVYRQRSRSERFKRALRSAVVSFFFAAAFAIFALAPKMSQLLPAIVGGLFGISFMILGWRVNVLRYFFVGAGAFAAGLIIALLTDPFMNQTGLLFSAIGGIMALGGVISLWIYLKRNPLQSEDWEDKE